MVRCWKRPLFRRMEVAWPLCSGGAGNANSMSSLQTAPNSSQSRRELTPRVRVAGRRMARWIVTGGSDATGPGLFKIPLEGGSPVRLVAGPALNPVWSPDGSLIVYAGTNVSTFAPLLAVRPDGTSVELPHISLRRLGEHVRFSPDGKSLIYMQGLLASQDFWLLDLASMKSRPLTRLQNRATMRTFDVTQRRETNRLRPLTRKLAGRHDRSSQGVGRSLFAWIVFSWDRWLQRRWSHALECRT